MKASRSSCAPCCVRDYCGKYSRLVAREAYELTHITPGHAPWHISKKLRTAVLFVACLLLPSSRALTWSMTHTALSELESKNSSMSFPAEIYYLARTAPSKTSLHAISATSRTTSGLHPGIQHCPPRENRMTTLLMYLGFLPTWKRPGRAIG